MQIREHIIMWVKAGSTLATGKDLVAQLLKNAVSMTFLPNALGNQNHILIAMLTRVAGIDPRAVKVVVYSFVWQSIDAVFSDARGFLGPLSLTPNQVNSGAKPLGA